MTASKKYTVHFEKKSPKKLNVFKVWVASPRGVAVAMMDGVTPGQLEQHIAHAGLVADRYNRSRGL